MRPRLLFFFMVQIQELQSRVEQALASALREKNTPESLFAPIDYTLSGGGKRLRPLLALMGAGMIGGKPEEALSQAVALEIFHNFTLLHDDLMDKSPLRRGRETVYVRWDENAAILSGDAMSILAYEKLVEGLPADRYPAILKCFTATALDVCRGQQWDMDFEKYALAEVSIDGYLEMIRLKTAVLLGASLSIGALAAGASSREADELFEIGSLLGLAFQIQDDLLDVYGLESQFGKPIGGDIRNNKKTLLLLYCYQQLDAEGRKALEEALRLPSDRFSEKLDLVLALYDQAGVRAYAEDLVNDMVEEALGKIEAFPVSYPAYQAALYRLSNNLLSRDH